MKPLFNTALNALNWTLQPNLPARFTGVTSRVFPLKARMDLLQAFCDSYLNLAPDIVRFQPALPYVYLMVLNYGRMAAEIENLGWVSQHEVAFAVPLAWYRVEKGKPIFVDIATVCPFIFVDNELSLSTGREVYGWPKVRAFLEPEVSPWLADPRNPESLLSLSTVLYRTLFAGQRPRPEVLLEVRKRPLPSFSQFPPDLSNPLAPLLRLPTAVASSLKLLGQVFEAATRLPILGYSPRSGLPAPPNGLRSFNPFSAPAPLNQITLKQFRDAELPGHPCYQALVHSQIRTTRFNGGGLLGELNLLAGDLTGGFEILVHRYAAQPIIESLGLDVARQTSTGDVEVAVLEPVLPYWVDVDLEYGTGEALCWRTRHSDWYTDDPAHPAPVSPVKPGPHPINTALGASMQDVAGPFDFPNTTVRVLPLMADENRLQTLCDKYLNQGVDNALYRFEPWGSYVYLVVTNFEEMSSARQNLGRFADRELTFFMPVKWYDRKDPARLLSVGLVPVFGFANSGTAAITAREVDGLPTLTASIQSPPDCWLEESGPSEGTDRGLLKLATTIFPAAHLGQRAEWKPIMEIHEYDALPYNDDVRWRALGNRWGRDLRNEVGRKNDTRQANGEEFENARALAIELLANGQPFNTITLKQFRDVGEPLRACYQALVRGRRTIDVAYDLREIEQRIHLSIRQYPNLPIVEMLGLKTKWRTTGAEVIDILQPIRPFWMRIQMKEDLGQNLCWRTDETWVQEKDPGPLYFESPDPTDVGASLVKALDDGELDKQRLRSALTEWRRGLDKQGKKPELTRAQAAEAVEAIEPQMVIESVLSREWQNWGNPRSSRGLAVKPDFCVPCYSVGELTTRLELFDTPDAGEWYAGEKKV